MKAKQKTASAQEASTPDSNANAITLLKADHRKVLGLFRQFKSAGDSGEKSRLARQICTELIVHTKIEEEIFYPACRAAATDEHPLDEAQVEHDSAKVLIAGLLRNQPDSPFYDARMAVLSEYIRHHVGEEEKPGSGIFARARAAKLDMTALGQRLQERKEELMAQAEQGDLSPSAPRSLELQSTTTSVNRGQEEQSTMPRQYERDRDQQGRFSSDQDERGGGRGYAARSSYRDRDDQGRFMSEDESGGRSYRNEDDDYRSSASRGSGGGSQGRGRGGWFGDSESPSRASEEGWDNRGGGRSGSSRYEDDEDYRSSRASQGGAQGRGQGGWFGDSEGHSRASEDGWENRGGSRPSSSRGYDEERGEERGRNSSSGGQRGGWFGDARGHSEASRRGWQNR